MKVLNRESLRQLCSDYQLGNFDNLLKSEGNQKNAADIVFRALCAGDTFDGTLPNMAALSQFDATRPVISSSKASKNLNSFAQALQGVDEKRRKFGIEVRKNLSALPRALSGENDSRALFWKDWDLLKMPPGPYNHEVSTISKYFRNIYSSQNHSVNEEELYLIGRVIGALATAAKRSTHEDRDQYVVFPFFFHFFIIFY